MARTQKHTPSHTHTHTRHLTLFSSVGKWLNSVRECIRASVCIWVSVYPWGFCPSASVCVCGLLSGAGGTKSNQHNELQAPLSGIKRKKYIRLCAGCDCMIVWPARECVWVWVRRDCTHTARSFGQNTARNNVAGLRDKPIRQDRALSLTNRLWNTKMQQEVGNERKYLKISNRVYQNRVLTW